MVIKWYSNDIVSVVNVELNGMGLCESESISSYHVSGDTATKIPASRMSEMTLREASTLWNNIVSLTVHEMDSSYRTRGLMQRPQLILKFALPSYVEIPVGAWCMYQGEKYSLHTPQNIKKQGTRNVEYTLTMGTYEDNMTLYKMRNTVDGRLKYSMCSTPAEFIAEIVANLNARDGANVWHVGDCIDTTPKTVEFNHTYVSDALTQVAEVFDTEYEIANHYIHLHPVKYNEDSPLPLSYGRGNGFEPGVGRTVPSGEMPIKILYVQGGDRNIDRSTYGHPELLLPLNQTLRFDGEKFEGETGFVSAKAREYQSDSNGYYIKRIDAETDSTKEDSIDCSDSYPSRVGTISSVVVVDASKNFYDFIDSSIPNDLDYSACQIEGETMTVIFQTGMLAGKEFDLQSYKHSTRRFEIVPQEIDGQTMPNSTYIPAAGDTYIIYGCTLPSAYICDNNSKTGASWDMFRQAVRYLYANEDPKFTFSGKLQALWSRTNWATISPKLKIGGYIHFTDTQFAPSGTDIRIVGIKDYLTDPYAPTLDISNGIVGQSINTTLVQVGSQEVVMGEYYDNSIAFTKRRFRDAKETMAMLEEALLDNFTESISPVAIQTMQMLVGDESLQFKFIAALNDVTEVSHVVVYDNNSKRLASPAGVIMHMTLGIANIQCQYDPTSYKKWQLPAFTSSVLSNGSRSYYLYARVSKTAQTGEFLLSENAIALEGVSGYYHLLVGILNKEYEGERSYVDLYGFTEILPGRITTDKIVSSNGNTYFDLVNNIIHGKMTFLSGTSGYNNITDKPDLSHYIEDTDGVIDIYYNTGTEPTANNAPASSWTTDAMKREHVGDLYRYKHPVYNQFRWFRWEAHNTTQRDGGTQSSGTIVYQWNEILTIPSWFSYIPPATKMFFNITPVPPYSQNDKWLNGGVFLKCLTAKTANEEFSMSDWDDSQIYDNTQTVIDGGIVTSGTVQLAGNGGDINAGITGNGTSNTSVRIWAGDTFNNRASAPFRVLQNGKVYMTEANISGNSFVEGKVNANGIRLAGASLSNIDNYPIGDNYGTNIFVAKSGCSSVVLPNMSSSSHMTWLFVMNKNPNSQLTVNKPSNSQICFNSAYCDSITLNYLHAAEFLFIDGNWVVISIV